MTAKSGQSHLIYKSALAFTAWFKSQEQKECHLLILMNLLGLIDPCRKNEGQFCLIEGQVVPIGNREFQQEVVSTRRAVRYPDPNARSELFVVVHVQREIHLEALRESLVDHKMEPTRVMRLIVCFWLVQNQTQDGPPSAESFEDHAEDLVLGGFELKFAQLG